MLAEKPPFDVYLVNVNYFLPDQLNVCLPLRHFKISSCYLGLGLAYCSLTIGASLLQLDHNRLTIVLVELQTCF